MSVSSLAASPLSLGMGGPLGRFRDISADAKLDSSGRASGCCSGSCSGCFDCFGCFCFCFFLFFCCGPLLVPDTATPGALELAIFNSSQSNAETSSWRALRVPRAAPCRSLCGRPPGEESLGWGSTAGGLEFLPSARSGPWTGGV